MHVAFAADVTHQIAIPRCVDINLSPDGAAAILVLYKHAIDSVIPPEHTSILGVQERMHAVFLCEQI